MTNTTLLFSLEGPVATITLNRPEKLNAMDPPMLTQLEQVCQDLERDTTVRVVLLTGAGTQRSSCLRTRRTAAPARHCRAEWCRLRRRIRAGTCRRPAHRSGAHSTRA